MATSIPPYLRDKGSQEQMSPSTQIYTSQDIAAQFATKPADGTLSASSCAPDTLARILIFRNQHPHYPPKIFVKTNLHLLNSSPGTQIPLFIGDRSAFEFGGWVVVKDVQRLPQRSDELVEMLTEKWKSNRPRRGKDKQVQAQTRPRSETAWKSSLSVDWAVVTLEEVEGRRDDPMDGPAVVPAQVLLPASDADECLQHQEERSTKSEARSITDDYEQPSRPSSPSTTSTTPTKFHAQTLISTFSMTKIQQPPSPSLHSVLSSSASSLLPSDALDHESPPDHHHDDITYKDLGMEESIAMVDDFASCASISSDNEDDGMIDDESDRWSELSSGPVDKHWTVVDGEDGALMP